MITRSCSIADIAVPPSLSGRGRTARAMITRRAPAPDWRKSPGHEYCQPRFGRALADRPTLMSHPIATQFEPIPRVVRLLLLMAVVAQLGDAITFALGSQMIGIGQESNGLIASLYRHAGLSGVLLLKGWAI